MAKPAVVLLWQDYEDRGNEGVVYVPFYYPAIHHDDDKIKIIDNQAFIEETTAMAEAMQRMPSDGFLEGWRKAIKKSMESK